MLSNNNVYSILYFYRKNKGRNNSGRITVRGRGGGKKQKQRYVLYGRRFLDKAVVVVGFAYDPNRNANLAVIFPVSFSKKRTDSFMGFFFVLSCRGMSLNQVMLHGGGFVGNPGNFVLFKNIPLGCLVYCVEKKEGISGYCRAAGCFGQVVFMDRTKQVSGIRLRSGFILYVSFDCGARLGVVGNTYCYFKKYKKAGVRRNLGFRPQVRGVAINPVDHPHGGGEGKGTVSKRSVNPWGRGVKGKKLRK